VPEAGTEAGPSWTMNELRHQHANEPGVL
jgi:hypothetical protein